MTEQVSRPRPALLHAAHEGPTAGLESEVYDFACRRCGATWTTTYLVHRHPGDEGDELEFYFLDRVPVPSPRCGVSCVSCRGYRVSFRRR